eukprot:505216_1
MKQNNRCINVFSCNNVTRNDLYNRSNLTAMFSLLIKKKSLNMIHTINDKHCRVTTLSLNQSNTTETAIDHYIPPISPSSSSITRKSNTKNEHSILTKHGYNRIKKIHSTDQYELLEAEIVSTSQFLHKRSRKVTIKKAEKSSYMQHISTQNAIHKESLILYHLTVLNRPIADSLVQYIDFLESDNYYYLITAHVNINCTLQQFVSQAHQYIQWGKLKRKEYHKILKHIFWQIFAAVNWLHSSMQCCHLNFKLNNIILDNADFIFDKSTDSVSINPSVFPTLFDFSNSEIFKIPAH